MKTRIKNSVSFFAFALALSFSCILGCGCTKSKPESDPLLGWHGLGFDLNNVDKVVQNDYQNYIQQSDLNGYVGPIQFFEDGMGQHAVEFEAFEHAKNASWHYVLIYDKENKRIRLIKYDHLRYQS